VRLAHCGWQIAQRQGEPIVELTAIVVNESESPVQCEVRFVMERRELRAHSRRATAAGDVRARTDGPWRVVDTVSVVGGHLPPGAACPISAELPGEALRSGAAHRVLVDLVDPSTGAPLDSRGVAARASPAVSAAAVVGVAILSDRLISDSGVTLPGGPGVMEGEHVAYRVGGEWVDGGSGTISVRTTEGLLSLDYTYTARGPSAASLTATATATGWLRRQSGLSLPVTITSSSARMTFPGARREVGSLISRSGATATGTFTGTVGEDPCSGLLTMTNGSYTLDTATDRGQHRFEIQVTGSIAGDPRARPAPHPRLVSER
jgi:hypothetical protein